LKSEQQPPRRGGRRNKGERAPPTRSIHLSDRRTSVRLEAIVWASLEDIARDQERSFYEIFCDIDQHRGKTSLTEAIKVYVIEYYRKKLAAVES
jgi:predicted DNA-binding ribbon-helix-helix protein